MQRIRRGILAVVLLLTGGVAYGSGEEEVAELLRREEAPVGVVFEIVTGAGDALEWAIPAVRRYGRQLRERFPDLSLADVEQLKE